MKTLSLILGVISSSAHIIVATNSTNTTIAPTSPPTGFMDPWQIGETEYEVISDNGFAYLEISNTIGNGVEPGDIAVELYDYDCEVKQNSTGLVVELNATGYNSTPHVYEALVNAALINNDTEGFVSFFTTIDGYTGHSIGTIRFCARISTFAGPIEVTFRFSRWALSFNMTHINFEIENVEFEESDIDDFEETNVDFDFSVQACLCDGDGFDCTDDPDPVFNQNDNPCFCLTPVISSSPELIAPVDIVNYDLQLSGGEDDNEVIYNPVEYGSNGPESNTLTSVSTGGPSGKTEKICTVIVAAFYTNDLEELSASGSCYLAFHGDEERGLAQFETFDISFGIEPAPQGGCLKGLFENIMAIFGSTLESITGSVQGAEEAASDAVDSVLGFFDDFSVSDIPDLASEAVDFVVDSGSDAVDSIGDTISDVAGDAVDVVEETAGDIAGDAVDVVEETVGDAADTIQDTIDGAVEDFTNFFPF